MGTEHSANVRYHCRRRLFTSTHIRINIMTSVLIGGAIIAIVVIVFVVLRKSDGPSGSGGPNDDDGNKYQK